LESGGRIQAGASINSAEQQPRGNAGLALLRPRAELANRWQNTARNHGYLGPFNVRVGLSDDVFSVAEGASD